MKTLLPTFFTKATEFEIKNNELVLDSGKAIKLSAIEKASIQPAWTPFWGITSDVTLSSSKEDITLHNLKHNSKNLLETALKNQNVKVEELPFFVSGKRILTPDIAFSQKSGLVVIVLLVIALLIFLLYQYRM
jgi:hypothetical protein